MKYVVIVLFIVLFAVLGYTSEHDGTNGESFP
jgi:hypothetical protein